MAEERYRMLVEQLPVAVYREVYRKENTHIYLSPQIEKILGYTLEELNAKPDIWHTAIHPDDRAQVMTESERTDQTLEPYRVEYRAIRKDGTVIWLQDQAVVICDENGFPQYWQGLLIDITERKKIEAAVTQSEERFSKVFHTSPIAICITSWEDGRFVDANRSYLDLAGYPRAELINRSVFEFGFVNPQERNAFLAKLMKEKSIKGVEDFFLTRSGEALDVITFYEMISLNGQDCILSMFYDITEQKRVRDSLSKSEISYRGLFNTVKDAIYIQDGDGTFLDVNEGAINMYGYSREELIGKTPADIGAPGKNDNKEVEKKIKLALEGEAQQFEFWGQRKNGEIFPKNVRLSKGSYFGRDVLIAFAEDITERKKTEEDLQAAEARYRALVEQLPAVVYIDATTSAPVLASAPTLYISPQIETLMGYTSAEWMAKNDLWEKSLYPDDHDTVIREELEAKNKGAPLSHEYRLITRDGRVVWVYDHSVLIRDQDGSPLYYQGIFLDMTKQRQAEDAIHQSEELFTKVFEASSIAICITQLKSGHFIDANQAYWNLSGMKPSDALGHSAFDLAVWKNTEEYNQLLERLKNNGAVRGMEDKFVTSTGEVRDTLNFHELIRFGNQDCILSMFHDITEQKQAQDDLRRKEVILNAIAFAADQFLKSPQWVNHISAILEKLGSAAQTSRVYIFQKVFEDSSRILVSQLHEWCAAGVTSQIDNPDLQNFDLTEYSQGRWDKLLLEGQPVYDIINHLPPNEQAALAERDILSILCMPIMIEQEFWGFIGFDDCLTERVWSKSELDALGTAANILGAAMQREKSEVALQKQLKELMMLHTVALTNSTASSVDELITRVTEIIDNTLHPDNCGVLLIEADSRFIRPHKSYRGNVFSDVNDLLSLDRGVTGRTASTGQSVLLAKVSTAPEFVAISPKIQSELCVPIKSGGKVIGVINIESKIDSAFNESDERLINTIAGGLGTAIDKIKLFEAERRRALEAETLRDATTALTNSLNLEKLYEVIFDLLYSFTPYDSASIFFLQKNELEMVAGRNLPEEISLLGVRIETSNKWEAEFSNHRPLVMADAQTDPRFEPRKGTEYIHGRMGVPLIVKDQIIGMLNIDSRKVNAFSEEQATLIQTFVNQAAIAIENARIYQEEKNHTQIIEALADIANEFATTQELGPLLDKVAQRALELLRASHVAIYLVQSDNKTVKVVSAKGTYSKELISHTIEVGKGITGSVIAAGKSEIVNNTRKDPRTITVPGTPEEDGLIETMMCAPLILRTQTIGTINAWRLRSDGLFNESELNFLISIANQTSISIEMSRLFQETRRRALEAAALAEVGRDISATLEIDTVLDRIAAYAKDMLNAETSAVYLSTQEDTDLHAIAVYGVDAEEIKNDPLHLGNGIAGHIAVSNHGEIVNYAASDPRAVTIKGTGVNPTEHIMGVPLMTKDQLTGLLVVWRSGVESEFIPSELDFLGSLAQQAAVAIQNARLFAGEQKQRLREASMLDLMRLAASSLSLDEVNLTILGHLLKLIRCESGSIQLLKERRLQVSAVIGFDPDTIQRGNILHLDDFPLNNEIVTEKHPVRIGNVAEDERYRWLPGIKNIHSFLGVPIIFKDNVIGIATLDSNKIERFTKEDEDLALAIANNAANAIGNARLFEREQQRRQEAENLRVAASAITSSLDAREVLETILVALKQVVPYYSATMFLLEDDRVRVTAAQGLPGRESAINSTFPANNKLFVEIKENGGQPVILYDAQVDPRFEKWPAADIIRGWMGVPLITRGEIVGFITLDSDAVGTFDENSAALAETFAYQAAIAIENARLYEETRRRLEELEVVSRVSFALRSIQNPDNMLPTLLQEVLKVMNTDATSIWLYNSATNELDKKIASGWLAEIKIQHLRPNESIAGYVYRTGEVHIIQEFPLDPYTHPSLVSQLAIGWGGVAVPIRTSAQTIGVLIVALPHPRKVEPHQIQLLTTLSEIAGNAIHRAQLYAQSEEQVKRLTALRDVDTAIASSFDLRVTLNILLDHTLAQLNCDAAAIISYNPELHTLNHLSSLGFHPSSNIQLPIRTNNRLLNGVLQERKDLYVDNISDEPDHPRKELSSQEKFVSYYATPLISKGQVKGIFEVYLRKPFIAESDWLDFYHTMAGQAAIAIDNSQLFDNLQRSNQELSLAYDTTLEGWGKALELRDKETQGHTLRVTDLTLRLSRRMGVPDADLIHIRRGVLLHDIGKMAVPDTILKKTGPLSEEEWIEMRMHPQHAYDLLYPITYLRAVLDIPYAHHERWDGSGYPRGLKGEDIPLAARIFAVVDVWDALLFDRTYRGAWPKEKVIEYMQEHSGILFEPAIVHEFLRMIAEDEMKTG